MTVFGNPINPLPRPVSASNPASALRGDPDARLRAARAYEYAQRHGVSTIYGLALATAEAEHYIVLRGCTSDDIMAGLRVRVQGREPTTVTPIFMNGRGWAYLVSDLVAAAKGA